jgi:alpha-tubulin suppressor-like RCC1 family protein
VSGWENVAAISCGIYHSIAVTFDGRILAVGSNGWGQLAIQTD